MKDIKYKYFIIKGINDSIKTIIDRERKVIFEIRDGNYINKTKEIMRIYEKDKKTDFMKGYVGTKFLNAIVDGESNNFSSREILLKTNDRKKFDMECMQIRKDQTERRLNSINRDFEKLLKGEQYYTYAFSNLDYVIGEDKLDDRYFQNNNIIENTLNEILKPKPYEEKEVEVTILDEEYDLGTTFYYIEKTKDEYEKFMKYLSENIVVKEIWKDNTLIVGLNEFVNNHIKEISNVFGKQTAEVHIENLIKMIDGNVTESCYEDFNKEFKTNYQFMFCNNYTLEKIKTTSIEYLDYEKAHDLAIIENREAHVSAYLGVYDNKFQLTYSIHSKNDYDNNFVNLKAIPDEINIKDITTEQELEDAMKLLLRDFYNVSSIQIEEMAEKLNEDKGNIEQDETEESEEEI